MLPPVLAAASASPMVFHAVLNTLMSPGLARTLEFADPSPAGPPAEAS